MFCANFLKDLVVCMVICLINDGISASLMGLAYDISYSNDVEVLGFQYFDTTPVASQKCELTG